jgi:hypothetical protein
MRRVSNSTRATARFDSRGHQERDLVRRKQGLSAEVDAIRHVLIEGEASGELLPFDAAKFKQSMLTLDA